MSNPDHSDKLTVLGSEPFNAEPDLGSLLDNDLTPVEHVYCRNHCDIPRLSDHLTIKLDGLVEKEAELSLDNLKAIFPSKSVVAALQCAGNRRKKMAEHSNKEVEGIKWGEGTICNIKWTGVPLRDVLLHAGVREGSNENLHVCLASHSTTCQDDDHYGVSIPLEKAMDANGDVLLAYKMNDEPLTADHGYPLRVVVPGYSGVRWVKWVDHITVTSQESQNFYQQKDYKVLPGIVDTREKAESEDWWSRIPALQANPLNSVVGSMKVERKEPSGEFDLIVRGYALSGPGLSGQVKQVDVSPDKGQTWTDATITYQDGRWSWTLWEACIHLPAPAPNGKSDQKRTITVWSRAMDEQSVQQMPESDWNLRGVAYNAMGQASLTFDL